LDRPWFPGKFSKRTTGRNSPVAPRNSSAGPKPRATVSRASVADNGRAKNYLEHLTHTVPTNSLDAWGLSIALSNSAAQIIFPQIANCGFEVQATPDFLNPTSWSPLDLPGNAPLFSISNRTATVEDTLTSGTNKFYRVRVFEP
jgi:hypothetical protein